MLGATEYRIRYIKDDSESCIKPGVKIQTINSAHLGDKTRQRNNWNEQKVINMNTIHNTWRLIRHTHVLPILFPEDGIV